MGQWEEIRHQVSIAGRVTDALTGRAVPSARVDILSGPREFTDWVSENRKQYAGRWDSMKKRTDRTLTQHDGHFHFMDLPDGQYTLQAWMPVWGSRYSKASCTVTVAHGQTGNIIMAHADMTLIPTCIKGQVYAENSADPIVLAEIRVQGSDEWTFSNENGDYILACVETGERTITASAQGFQPVSHTVLLDQPGEQKSLNMVMGPETS